MTMTIPASAERTPLFHVFCGNCKSYHQDVEDVRECCQARKPSLPWRDDLHDRATQKQQSFINDLREERGMDRIDASQLSKVDASGTIAELLKQPRHQERPVQAARVAAGPAVENGRYALRSDGGVKFYKVNTPTDGAWAGRTFVDVQASDDFHPIRNKVDRAAILLSIAFDPKAAMELYGQQLGKCGHCGRTLTDEESRARGIGPICAQKMGW